jgi:hypothetical protein
LRDLPFCYSGVVSIQNCRQRHKCLRPVYVVAQAGNGGELPVLEGERIMEIIDNLTEQQARERLDDAAERLKALGVILIRDNETKVPAPEPYEETYK